MNTSRFNYLIKNLSKSESLFSELYSYYYPKIRIHLYRKFRNKQLSEDIAQDFFIKIFDMEIEEPIETPTAWVFRVCDNLAKNQLIKQKNECPLSDVTVAAAVDDYERFLYGGYIDLLNRLDAETRELIIKHVFEGYSWRELAREMNVSYAAIRKRYSRGLKILRKMSHSAF